MLTPTDRTSLASLATHLAPNADPAVLHAFVRAHEAECRAELGSDEATEQLRAILIRVLPMSEASQQAVREVLLGYPAAVREHGRTLLLTRHPAWVGLAWLELAGGPENAPADTVKQAVGLASEGFAVAALPGELGPGEVLWAMAEQAEGVGWADRYHALMALALDADFADAAQQAEVRLLVGMHRAQQNDASADALLDLVVRDEQAELRSRVHASWVVAHRDATRAEALLTQALAWAKEDESDQAVLDRLNQALDGLRTPGN